MSLSRLKREAAPSAVRRVASFLSTAREICRIRPSMVYLPVGSASSSSSTECVTVMVEPSFLSRFLFCSLTRGTPFRQLIMSSSEKNETNPVPFGRSVSRSTTTRANRTPPNCWKCSLRRSSSTVKGTLRTKTVYSSRFGRVSSWSSSTPPSSSSSDMSS